MKVSVVIATAMVWGVGVGYSNYSWSGDLDSALEDINISTDAQNVVKKTDKDAVPCIKAEGASCPTSQDYANTNVYEASAIKGAIVSAPIPNVTINGVSSGDVANKGAVSLGRY
jgi:hypothetical protein